ncbi:hypothetical protein ZIOFF_028996 [Zingiber officinale]|uniref:Uncharacterized protein n=1 Tax=Zingiber officinale TaxID=94328 RepID=A0A8J5H0S1_ZINOF|nr:hypothetical protein ZIOFF_028996 [Zingiber officinale]
MLGANLIPPPPLRGLCRPLLERLSPIRCALALTPTTRFKKEGRQRHHLQHKLANQDLGCCLSTATSSSSGPCFPTASFSGCESTAGHPDLGKVGLEVQDDNIESPKAIPDINKIVLEDNPSCGLKTDRNPVPDDTSRDNATLQEQSDASSSNNSSKTTFANDKLTKLIIPEQVRGAKYLEHASQEPKPIAKNPVARAKVSFEKGYNQMDWLKITRTHPDLADLFLGYEEFDGVEDDIHAEFPCSFCSDDFDIVGFCCHINDKLPIEAKDVIASSVPATKRHLTSPSPGRDPQELVGRPGVTLSPRFPLPVSFAVDAFSFTLPASPFEVSFPRGSSPPRDAIPRGAVASLSEPLPLLVATQSLAEPSPPSLNPLLSSSRRRATIPHGAVASLSEPLPLLVATQSLVEPSPPSLNPLLSSSRRRATIPRGAVASLSEPPPLLVATQSHNIYTRFIVGAVASLSDPLSKTLDKAEPPPSARPLSRRSSGAVLSVRLISLHTRAFLCAEPGHGKRTAHFVVMGN